MTWIILRALGLLGSLRSAVGALVAWAGRNPAWALCAALAAVCGLLWHEWSVKAGQVKHLASEIAQFRDAQAQATAIAQQALRHQEAVYQQKATEADHAYQTQLAAAQSAADRYIAGHRLRADGASGASSTPASAQGSNPASPDRPDNHADMVAVSADDINACTVNSTRLQAARDWALGLAKPD